MAASPQSEQMFLSYSRNDRGQDTLVVWNDG